MTAKIQPRPIDECRTCRFWDAIDGAYGLCRRQPPTIDHGLPADQYADRGLAAWPLSQDADWCGEWQGGAQ